MNTILEARLWFRCDGFAGQAQKPLLSWYCWTTYKAKVKSSSTYYKKSLPPFWLSQCFIAIFSNSQALNEKNGVLPTIDNAQFRLLYKSRRFPLWDAAPGVIHIRILALHLRSQVLGRR
jgi:hypothetical protein